MTASVSSVISTANEKDDTLIISQVPSLWTIPRPALLRRPSSSQLLNQYQSDQKPESSGSDAESQPASYLTSATTLSESYPDSTSAPSSNQSTQSGSSGYLFLTVANLAALRENSSSYHGFQKSKQMDTASLASSTHFTLVNGMETWRRKPVKKCWCESHQLTALVTAMCVILSCVIFICVYLTEKKINEPDRFS